MFIFKLLFISLLLITNLFAGEYFQQDVSYKIDAELEPTDDLLILSTNANYVNNSPDTLKEIYLRLFWNIFGNDSYGRNKYGSTSGCLDFRVRFKVINY